MSADAFKTVTDILGEFAEDWGLDDIEITSETLLKADIGFESTDTMQLFSALQEAYPQTKLPFQELVMHDGKFVSDLSVAQVSEFISQTVQKVGAA